MPATATTTCAPRDVRGGRFRDGSRDRPAVIAGVPVGQHLEGGRSAGGVEQGCVVNADGRRDRRALPADVVLDLGGRCDAETGGVVGAVDPQRPTADFTVDPWCHPCRPKPVDVRKISRAARRGRRDLHGCTAAALHAVHRVRGPRLVDGCRHGGDAQRRVRGWRHHPAQRRMAAARQLPDLRRRGG